MKQKEIRKMKYIRTNDKDNLIIDMTNNVLAYHITENGYIDFNRFGMFKIIKQADTIEELFDEFVVEDRDEFAIFHNLKLAKQTKGIIYGAIWTEKGLIYVATTNDKGELELL